MTKNYKEQLASIMYWDPADNKEGYKAEIKDVEALKQLVLTCLTDKGYTLKPDQVDPSVMPAINSMLLIHGAITPADYILLTTKDKDVRGKFPFALDNGEKFVEAAIKAQAENWEIIKSGKAAPVGKGTSELKPLSSAHKKAVDAIMTMTKNPDWDTITQMVLEGTGAADPKEVKELQDQIKTLQDAVANGFTSAITPKAQTYEGDGTIPEGKTVTKKASEVFPGVNLSVDFELPVWEWDGVHPDVPQKDPHYIFRPQELTRALYAIVTNKRAYFQGHTGSGKTTLLEQVAAHLNWPFARINFDSEITRMDLIGRDTLTVDKDGNTVSKFVDGILPRMMSGPYIGCFDEIDFARPDVAYVMQAALEGNGLRITEDGDRTVQPHAMFRMFATGNTVGQGDEEGMYQGARAQSLAFLDRFTVWCKVDYLDAQDREELVTRHYPMLTKKDQKVLSKYVEEHLEAFTGGTILQPISPRGMLSIAEACVITGSMREALHMTVLDRASKDDRATLLGIIDRVC